MWQRGRALAIGLLSRISAVVYLVPFIPVKYKKCRLLVAILLALSQVYVVGMHSYLMVQYWLNKTVTSSQGLYMELLLYISAALTFPITTFYFLGWEISFGRFFGCCVGHEEKVTSLPCHQAGSCSTYLPYGTRVWLEHVEQEAIAASAGPPEYSSVQMETRQSTEGESSEQKADDLLACRAAGKRSGGQLSKPATPAKLQARLDDSEGEDAEETKLLQQQPKSPTSVVTLTERAGNWSSCFGSRRETSTTPHSDHLWVFLAGVVGNSLVLAYVAFDLGHERVFDEKNIRKFMELYHLSSTEVVLYWLYVLLVFWGMFSSVTACSNFHVLCVEERYAIDLAVVVLRKCNDLKKAVRLIDELVDFLRQRRRAMRFWFRVHTICFGCLLFVQLYFLLPSRHSGSKLLLPKPHLAAWGKHSTQKVSGQIEDKI